MITPIGEFLHALATAQHQAKSEKGFQVGIRIVVPPYPFHDAKTFNSYSKNATIAFANGASTSGIHIEDVSS